MKTNGRRTKEAPAKRYEGATMGAGEWTTIGIFGAGVLYGLARLIWGASAKLSSIDGSLKQCVGAIATAGQSDKELRDRTHDQANQIGVHENRINGHEIRLQQLER